MDTVLQTTSNTDRKENLQNKKAITGAQFSSFSPARNPLRDVNHQNISTPSKPATTVKLSRPGTPKIIKSQKTVKRSKLPISVYKDKYLVSAITPGKDKPKTSKIVKVKKVVRFEENFTIINSNNNLHKDHELQENDDELDEKIEEFVDSILRLTVEEIEAESKAEENEFSQTDIDSKKKTAVCLLYGAYNSNNNIETDPELFSQYQGLSADVASSTGSASNLQSPETITGNTSCSKVLFFTSTVSGSAPSVPTVSNDTDEDYSFQNQTTANRLAVVDKPLMTNFQSAASVEQTVFISPDVKDAGVSPLRRTTTDAQVSTELIRLVDNGSMVKPELCNMYTMTDSSSTSTKETSMTPMKILSKQGKRLTAAEVRSQHPRVIANQLDTVLVCNTQLSSDVRRLESERNKLKTIIKDLKCSLTCKTKQMEELELQTEEEKSQLEKMHFEVVREFQDIIENKNHQIVELEQEIFHLKANSTQSNDKYSNLEVACHDLEQQLVTLEKNHSVEVQLLKEEYEKTNYHEQFERSQQMVRELQAELNEFCDILDKLEETEKLQGELQNSVTEAHLQLRHVGIQNADMRKRLLTEFVALQKSQKKLERDRQNQEHQNEDLEEKCSNLTKVVEISNNNIQQLQALYSETSSDLRKTTFMVHHANRELMAARKAIQDLLFTNNILTKYLQDQQEKEKSLLDEKQALTNAILELEKELQTQKKLMQDVELKRLAAEAKLEEYISKSNLSVTNLQRTLDFREHDIDLLTKDMEVCQNTIQQQRCQIEKQAREKQLLEETIKNLEEEMMSLKQSAQFMEAEQDLLLTSIKECEEKIRSLSLELNQQERSLSVSEIRCLELQSTVQSLHSDLCDSREELDITKSHARKMLVQQGMELHDCREAIENLDLRMRCILRVMKRKVGIEDDATVDSDVKKAPQSLVTAVLEAAKKDTSLPAQNYSFSQGSTDLMWSCSRPQRSASVPLELHITDLNSPSNIQSPSYQSKQPVPGLRYSQSSAFSPVRPKSRLSSETDHETETFSDADCTRSCLSGGLSPSLDNGLFGMEVSSLVEQIQTLGEVLGEIVRMANIVERASQLSIQDLKGEEMLLRERIYQLESQAEHLQAEIVLKDEELAAVNQDVVQLQNRIKQMVTTMMDVSDQQTQIKKLKSEIENLVNQMKRLDSEKQVISEQYDKLIETLEKQADSQSLPEVRSLREIVGLKKENRHLKIKLCEEHDQYQDRTKRLERKVKSLEKNWKKAEAEVFRFDELVETIRKVFEENKSVIESHPSLAHLLQILSDEDVPEATSFYSTSQMDPDLSLTPFTPYKQGFFN